MRTIPALLTSLPIATRRTHRGDGEVERRDTVQCPARGASIDVTTCFECERCIGPDAGAAEIVCIPPGLAPEYERASRIPTVATVMTRNVECVGRGLSLDGLIALFLEHNISAVPVVDDDGHPIGIASKTDVVRWTYERSDTFEIAGPHEVIEPGSSVRTIPSATVDDVMMPMAFVLVEDSPISYAAALMATEGVHHIPVISADRQVVGIVAALDLVTWMAKQEGYSVVRRL